MIIDLPQPVAVVAHDAGAANLIIEWISIENPAIRPHMAGPAEVLWRRRFPGRPLLASLDTALDGARSVLTGTGWETDVEHHARQAGRAASLPSAAVIDHWVNYSARFQRGGNRVMPDQIWVTDEWAFEKARNLFPTVHVRRKPNSYLEKTASQIMPVNHSASGTLFILEPTRQDWGRGIAGEFQALEYFIKRRDRLNENFRGKVWMRLHPSEPPTKYDSWLDAHKQYGFFIDDSSTLAEAVSRRSGVVGIQSFALVVAAAAGRQVVSALPPWAPTLCLPHADIIQLRHLDNG